MFRNDRAILLIDAWTSMLIPLKRIFLSYSFSLFPGTRQLLLSSASSMKQFSNVYIHRRARSGSEVVPLWREKRKNEYNCKTSRAILICCHTDISILSRKERIREGIASSRDRNPRLGFPRLIGTGLILLRVMNRGWEFSAGYHLDVGDISRERLTRESWVRLRKWGDTPWFRASALPCPIFHRFSPRFRGPRSVDASRAVSWINPVARGFAREFRWTKKCVVSRAGHFARQRVISRLRICWV